MFVIVLSLIASSTFTVVANQEIRELQTHQCRFWGIIADSLPEDIVLNHLVDLPYSLKNLGAINRNGWGLAYYNDTQPKVLRGAPSAFVDPNFDLAAYELAESQARIGVGHVRAATSGASDIPNPHPFIRCKGGRYWTFGHNGALSKSVLKNLIGEEYLVKNPPTVGNNWDDPDVVDSDLYMLYILKCVEENDWNVIGGMRKAVEDISQSDSGAMNFFLTDGETLWGFCRGNTLYYYHSETDQQYSVIASQPPTGNSEGWKELYENNLVILTVDSSPIIIDDITTIPEFPPLLILPLFMVTTLLATIIYRKTRALEKQNERATDLS